MTWPNGGRWEFDLHQTFEEWPTYDEPSELSITDPEGHVTTYNYHAYAALGPTVKRDRNGASKLWALIDETGSAALHAKAAALANDRWDRIYTRRGDSSTTAHFPPPAAATSRSNASFSPRQVKSGSMIRSLFSRRHRQRRPPRHGLHLQQQSALRRTPHHRLQQGLSGEQQHPPKPGPRAPGWTPTTIRPPHRRDGSSLLFSAPTASSPPSNC